MTAALDDAWAISSDFGPSSAEGRDCAQAMVELYSAWNVAERNRGYDLRADEWKRTLATMEGSGDQSAR